MNNPFIKSIIFLIYALIVGTLFTLIGSLVGVLILDLDFNSLMSNQNLSSNEYLKILQLFTAVGIFIFGSLSFVYLFGDNPYRYFGLNKLPNLKHLAFAIIIMLLFQPFVSFLGYLNSIIYFPESLAYIEDYLKSMQEANFATMLKILSFDSFSEYIFIFILIAIIPAIGEELFFRGVLQPLIIKSSKSIHLGIFITAVVFSLFHMDFYGFIPRLFLGILLGYLYLKTENIWISAAAHFANNALAVILIYFNSPEEILNQDIANNSINYYYLILLTTASIGLIIYSKKINLFKI